MSKRKKKFNKNQKIVVMTADEATLAQNPRYNGYAVGHGAHGDKKYNRNKQKAAFKKAIRNDWSSSRFYSQNIIYNFAFTGNKYIQKETATRKLFCFHYCRVEFYSLCCLSFSFAVRLRIAYRIVFRFSLL